MSYPGDAKELGMSLDELYAREDEAVQANMDLGYKAGWEEAMETQDPWWVPLIWGFASGFVVSSIWWARKLRRSMEK